MFRSLLNSMNAIPTPTLVRFSIGFLIAETVLRVVNSESIRNRYGTLDLQRFVPGLGQNALKDTSGRRS
ncbi:hypothetical protein RHGRI_015077 [Rhododendron griersonianum]|uniref:Uncharacterized protein n=1 Tax=Rhododendron griersonianum TaxID=479676 RepID=A0AAV6KCQ5_9ERIC|nr:hypothetical protein RHGRI_015077 [Rhododendron griersonianum]